MPAAIVETGRGISPAGTRGRRSGGEETGRGRFAPDRAYELGLVNRIVPHDGLMPAAFGLAERILRHSPLAAARIITAVTRGLNASITEGLAIEREQFGRMAATRDVGEGLSAWIERRTPVYTGM